MGVTYLIIFLLAAVPFFEVAAIIPIAIIGGMPAIPTMITAFLGNLFTIVLLIIFVDKIRAWQKRRKKQKEGEEAAADEDTKKHKRARNIWGKYGLPGLAFVGPFFVGSHLSALLSITFGGTRERTLILMTASLFGWSIILGAAAYFGFDYLVADEDDLGFITRLLRIG